MLVNSLRSIDENTRLYISDFTLFVLDECHHTGQKHPYEELMKMVRKFVGDGSKSENPQVVGLTASIGTRKAQNTEQVGYSTILSSMSNEPRLNDISSSSA